MLGLMQKKLLIFFILVTLSFSEKKIVAVIIFNILITTMHSINDLVEINLFRSSTI